MGYYTDYSIELLNCNKEDEDTIIQDIKDTSGYADVFEESVKWYDYSADMKNVSLRYPEVTFILSGEGEEAGDIWKSYFEAGSEKHIRAKLTFEDPSGYFCSAGLPKVI